MVVLFSRKGALQVKFAKQFIMKILQLTVTSKTEWEAFLRSKVKTRRSNMVASTPDVKQKRSFWSTVSSNIAYFMVRIKNTHFTLYYFTVQLQVADVKAVTVQ